MKKKKNKNKNKPKWGVSVNVKCKYIYKDSSSNNYSYWTYKTNEYYTANQKNKIQNSHPMFITWRRINIIKLYLTFRNGIFQIDVVYKICSPTSMGRGMSTSNIHSPSNVYFIFLLFGSKSDDTTIFVLRIYIDIWFIQL